MLLVPEEASQIGNEQLTESQQIVKGVIADKATFLDGGIDDALSHRAVV